MSFAIAGYFKLKIYIVSLNAPSMNEENLGTLFGELPKQCVVLLEDIDTAGLTNTRQAPTDAEPAKPLITTLPSNATISPNSPPKENTNGKISLSALLNVIDGVSSSEGRVLIMTTNHIEKLDPALIRPGRVDMKVKFDLANTHMLSAIFRGIFAHIEGDYPTSAKVGATPIRSPKGTTIHFPNASETSEEEKISEEAFRERKRKEEENVDRLAAEFAAIIPTLTFSPADIQGYLLKFKREPEMAVRNAAEWVVATKLEKEKEKETQSREGKERAEREKSEKEKQYKDKIDKVQQERDKSEEEKKEGERATEDQSHQEG